MSYQGQHPYEQQSEMPPMNFQYAFDYYQAPHAHDGYRQVIESPFNFGYPYYGQPSLRPVHTYGVPVSDAPPYLSGQNSRFQNRGRHVRHGNSNRGRGGRNWSYSRANTYRSSENPLPNRGQQREAAQPRWEQQNEYVQFACSDEPTPVSSSIQPDCSVFPESSDSNQIEDETDVQASNCSVVSDDQIENQRDALAKQLCNGKYECMICCVNIRRQVAIWSCDSCYHLFHLFCIKKWSQSMKIGVAPISPVAAELARSGHKVWRCPACQKEHTAPSFRYFCFCGQNKDPESSHNLTPHTCGEVCGKSRGENCTHSCLILCHPGPCPPCDVFVTRTCLCGSISATSKCMSSRPLQCDKKCNLKLNCGHHTCNAVCHKPPCSPCSESIEVSCHCGSTSQTFVCGSADALSGSFSCQSRCDKTLACGEHHCRLICHPGPCPPCSRLPEAVVTCPCGRTPIAELLTAGERRLCTDPIPSCGSGAACERSLPCAHLCPQPCHDGDCPPCEQVRAVKCRCGKASKEVACAQWDPAEAGEFLCPRRCRKKKSCGRCRCGDLCCIDFDHVCNTVCGKLLSCGQHTCEKTCHLGRCPPCTRVSLSELRCTCGATALPSPVPCGTRPPDCAQPCSREHRCEHPTRHTCHADPKCPPCTVLVSKPCLGGHTVRHNIPCFQRSVTCGQPCGQALEGCEHRCNRACHEGPCLVPEAEGGEGCRQPCPEPRPECGHPCSAPCHVGQPCPGGQCAQQVEVHCGCGLKKKMTTCLALTTMNKWELWGALQGSQNTSVSIDVDKLSKKTRQAIKSSEKDMRYRRLECDSLCLQVERNRAVAEALNIADADLMPTPGAPSYSRFLREFARSNFDFANNVEKSLDELIRTAKESKHKSRSHSFQPMNRDKRRFVHELAEFYFCETQSYDAEPHRSVVVTAKKERCRNPTVRLSAKVQEDMREDAKLSGRIQPSPQVIRPVGGILAGATSSSTASASSTSGLQVLGRVPTNVGNKQEIDYFSD